MASVDFQPSSRSVYLITYSRADLEIVPNREKFVAIVKEAFQNNGKAVIVRWTCSQEHHQDGGIHYHMAIKLDWQKRWLSVRNVLDTKYGIKVNFSDKHSNYYDAWKYCTKEDKENCVLSENHPDLSDCKKPRTSAATNAKRASASETKQKKAKVERKKNLMHSICQNVLLNITLRVSQNF